MKNLKNKDDSKNKKVVISAAGVVALLLIVVGVTYAVFSYTGTGTKTNQVTTGTITMVYTEGTNRINITDAIPMDDASGKLLRNVAATDENVFKFNVQINITGKQAVKYYITAEKIVDDLLDNDGITNLKSTLNNNDVRLYLEKSTDDSNYTQVMAPSYYTPISETAGTTAYGADNGEMLLEQEEVGSTITNYYILRMWVADTYVMSGTSKRFSVKVNVYGEDGVYQTISAENVGYGDSGSNVAHELDVLHGDTSNY